MSAQHTRRLEDLANRKSRQATQIRNADNTALGERAAGEADLDAAAIRWALDKVRAIAPAAAE